MALNYLESESYKNYQAQSIDPVAKARIDSTKQSRAPTQLEEVQSSLSGRQSIQTTTTSKSRGSKRSISKPKEKQSIYTKEQQEQDLQLQAEQRKAEAIESGRINVIDVDKGQSRMAYFQEGQQLKEESRFSSSSVSTDKNTSDLLESNKYSKIYTTTEGDVIGAEAKKEKIKPSQPDFSSRIDVDTTKKNLYQKFLAEQKYKQAMGLSASPLLLPVEIISGARQVGGSIGRQVVDFGKSTIRGVGKQTEFTSKFITDTLAPVNPVEFGTIIKESKTGKTDTLNLVRSNLGTPYLQKEGTYLKKTLTNPDVQNAIIAESFLVASLLGGVPATIGKVAGVATKAGEGFFAGVGAVNFIRNPSIESGAGAIITASPIAVRGLRGTNYNARISRLRKSNFLELERTRDTISGRQSIQTTGKPFISTTTETFVPFQEILRISDDGTVTPEIETTVFKQRPIGFDVPINLPSDVSYGKGSLKSGTYIDIGADIFVKTPRERQLQLSPKEYNPYTELKLKQFTPEQIGISEPLFFEKAKSDILLGRQERLTKYGFPSTIIPERAQRLIDVRRNTINPEDISYTLNVFPDTFKTGLPVDQTSILLKEITSPNAIITDFKSSVSPFKGKKGSVSSYSLDTSFSEGFTNNIIKIKDIGKSTFDIAVKSLSETKVSRGIGIYGTGIIPLVDISTSQNIKSIASTNIFSPTKIIPISDPIQIINPTQDIRPIIDTKSDLGIGLNLSQTSKVVTEYYPVIPNFNFGINPVKVPTENIKQIPIPYIPLNLGNSSGYGRYSKVNKRNVDTYFADLPALIFGQKKSKPKKLPTSFTGFERRFILQ